MSLNDLKDLIQNKNDSLQGALNCSIEILEAIKRDDFIQLHSLEKYRDSLVKKIVAHDQEIANIAQRIQPRDKTPSELKELREKNAIGEKLVQQILKVDQETVATIEDKKERLRNELAESNKSSQIVKKFRSKWIPDSGEKLDGKV